MKNLVYNKFKLLSHDKSIELELTPRYYRAPSEILLDIHQAISNVAPVPLLIEKDGQLKMTMKDHWIEVNEGMFLNQNFKYVLYEAESQLVKRKKKDKGAETLQIIEEKIERIQQIMLGTRLAPGTRDSVDHLESRFIKVQGRITTLKNLGEWKKTDETKEAFVQVNNNIDGLVKDFEKVFEAIGTGDQKAFRLSVLKMSDEFQTIEMMIDDLETAIVGDNLAVKSLQGQVVFLKQAFDKTNYFLDELTPEPRKYSIDKSQICLLYTSPSPRDS